jgi:hypothetical protein
MSIGDLMEPTKTMIEHTIPSPYQWALLRYFPGALELSLGLPEDADLDQAAPEDIYRAVSEAVEEGATGSGLFEYIWKEFEWDLLGSRDHELEWLTWRRDAIEAMIAAIQAMPADPLEEDAEVDEITRTTNEAKRSVRQVVQAAQESYEPSWAHIAMMHAIMLRWVLERQQPLSGEVVVAMRAVVQGYETRDDHDKETVAHMLGEVIGQRVFGEE